MLVAVALVVALGLAVAKPWGGPPQAALLPSDRSTAVANVSTGAPAVAAPTVKPSSWPAQPSLGLDAADQASITAAMRLLAVDAGKWGVGDGGSGPRLTRDEVWSDWSPVTPGTVRTVAVSFPPVPASGACPASTTLAQGPLIVAVTAPDSISGLVLTAWWSGGDDAQSITRSVRQVSLAGTPATSGTPTAAYLVRVDQAPWPDGWYELRAATRERTYAIDVCIESPI